MISVLNTVKFQSPPNKSGLRFFAELVIEGKLSLLIYHTTYGTPGSIMYGYHHKKIWLKNNTMYDLERRKTWKLYPQILSDCPEIITIIENKDDRVDTYKKMTIMYNSLCGSDVKNNPQE